MEREKHARAYRKRAENAYWRAALASAHLNEKREKGERSGQVRPQARPAEEEGWRR